MPQRPNRPCTHPGCGRLTKQGKCDKHRKDYEQRRGSSTGRGYNYRWQQARQAFLVDNPLCVDCKAEGIVRAATEVDHEIPHRGDSGLFWDRSNWRARCKPHHSAKTYRGE